MIYDWEIGRISYNKFRSKWVRFFKAQMPLDIAVAPASPIPFSLPYWTKLGNCLP